MLVLGVGLLTARFETIGAINLLAAALFLAIAILRLIAAAQIRGRVPTVPVRRADEAELPIYTVLAPLHGEAEIAADLVRALLRLDWPREKLDVKIITEADDTKTLAAVRRAVEGTPFEVVVVPAGAPQTKPRALAYALPLARGEFVTVYDAEDRPHPGQLRQAWATFQEGDSNLACVQAALVIDNEEEGWLPRLFAIEYAALFDGLLPALAEHGMPVPLGGTSNHFRGIR
jgi:cellulose synthase/poly-beta-1,6-N-acetylglucosamine synthase-like glycosyltransferase